MTCLVTWRLTQFNGIWYFFGKFYGVLLNKKHWHIVVICEWTSSQVYMSLSSGSMYKGYVLLDLFCVAMAYCNNHYFMQLSLGKKTFVSIWAPAWFFFITTRLQPTLEEVLRKQNIGPKKIYIVLWKIWHDVLIVKQLWNYVIK